MLQTHGTILFMIYRFFRAIEYVSSLEIYRNLNCREQKNNHIARLILKRRILHTEDTEKII